MRLTLNNVKYFETSKYQKIKFNDTIYNISKKIISFIKEAREEDFEKGGFLISYKIKDVEEFTIKWMSFPIKEDDSSNVHFQISKKHKKIVNQYLKNSHKNLIVIGTWHTHPKIVLKPSTDDLYLYKRISKKSNLRFSLNIITTLNKTNFMIYDNLKKEIKNEIIF